MNSHIIAVYRKKTPDRWKGQDVMIYHRDLGFLGDPQSLDRSTIVWAEVEREAVRREARYWSPDLILLPTIYAWLEKEIARKRYCPYAVIKRAIHAVFGGPKPQDVSWNKARRLAKEKQRREAEGKKEPVWSSFMTLRAGAPAR